MIWRRSLTVPLIDVLSGSTLRQPWHLRHLSSELWCLDTRHREEVSQAWDWSWYWGRTLDLCLSQPVQRRCSEWHSLWTIVRLRQVLTVENFKYFRCPSWLNDKSEHFIASSECDNGAWSASVPVPPSTPLFPSSLPSPGSPPVSCSCPPLLLNYDPNTESGTMFHCDTDLDWSTLPITISPGTRCYLLCDTMLVDIVQCRSVLSWCIHIKKAGCPPTHPSMVLIIISYIQKKY